mmetsp:Transcript_16163/g.46419  ORF Transcript_16163/g.46419 Transcript_16163/m.46419 type:complete len:91 (-) Transcript_16163:278-550(-)
MKKAAELDFPQAIGYIGSAFSFGGVSGIATDEKKCMRYLADAAKKGYVTSRFNLGLLCERAGKFRIATKHYRLAAEAGDPDSVKEVRESF